MNPSLNTSHLPFSARNVSEDFSRLMEESNRRAYSMALQLTRNPSEAEDLLQETSIKAWRGFESYVPGRPFLNWLMRIMQRAHLDLKRRDNPIRKADSLDSLMSTAEGEARELNVPDHTPGPQQELFLLEFRRELAECLEELPSFYREALVMCDIQGMSYNEIADVQKTTVGTVRSRIHRGRKVLRDLVKARGLKLPSDFSFPSAS